MSHQVVNGAKPAADTSEERSVIGERAILTVHPGNTACYVDNGIKWPGGRRVAIYKGEMDGVKVAVTEREGIVHVFLTKNEIIP